MENQAKHNIEELKLRIEKMREELDACIERGDYSQVYEKSKELDKLIEKYMDMSK